jgi:hypothetical protein
MDIYLREVKGISVRLSVSLKLANEDLITSTNNEELENKIKKDMSLD